MKRVGFKHAQRTLLQSIDEGSIRHEVRAQVDQKNLLYAGAVTMSDVRTLIERARGNQYESRQHHWMSDTEVHILKASSWYIKWYILEPNAVFISVHPLRGSHENL